MKNEEQTIIIEPKKTISRYWYEIWQYRELFVFLAWRDVVVKYKQTVFGILWSILRVFVTLVVFTVIFGKVANLDPNGVPYALLVCVGTIPWFFFSSAFPDISNSLLANTNILSKIYFPRLIIPISTIVVNLVDTFFAFIILIGLLIWYGVMPTWNIVALPLFFILEMIICLGAGSFIASLNVKFRDFRYVVPFIMQIGAYVSPVGFDSGKVPDDLRILYSLNPMVGVIDGFRWAILGDSFPIYWPSIIISVVIAIVLLIFGIYYFRRTERYFADII